MPTIQGNALSYNAAVWQKFHILGRVQVFIVSTMCAAVIAGSFASVVGFRDGFLRDLFWPHQFDFFVNFSAFFLLVIPLFLGYYHLARLGVLLSLLVSALTYFAMGLCALFIFSVHADLLGAVAYVGAGLLLCILLFAAHMKASKSRVVREAQRLLRLTSFPQIR
jgi:hypothetical protein